MWEASTIGIVFLAIVILGTLIASAVYFFKISNNSDVGPTGPQDEQTIYSWSNPMSIIVVTVIGVIGLIGIVYLIYRYRNPIGSGLGTAAGNKGKRLSTFENFTASIKVKSKTYKWGLLILSLLIIGTLIVNVVYYANAINHPSEANVPNIDNKAMLAFNIIGLILTLVLIFLYWRSDISIADAAAATASSAIVAAGGTPDDAAAADTAARSAVASGAGADAAAAIGIVAGSNGDPALAAGAAVAVGANPAAGAAAAAGAAVAVGANAASGVPPDTRRGYVPLSTIPSSAPRGYVPLSTIPSSAPDGLIGGAVAAPGMFGPDSI